MLYDAAIIGGGVVGTLTARELSKYEIKTVLLEKNSDIAAGTTKANSGIVHAGYNARPGSLKAKLNVRGCALMEELCGLLHVPYRNNGSLVTAFCDDEMKTLEILLRQGAENKVPELKIIGRDELKGLEPNISDEAAGALFAPTAGIVSPYELASAAAECAVLNGVTLIRNFKVTDIDFSDGLFSLNGGEIRSRLVINAAGLYASLLAEAFDGEKFETTPRLGEYGLLDQSCRGLVTHTIFQCPVKMGKGVLVTPTVHGNILVGPSAVDISDRDDVSVRRGALSEIFRKGAKSVPSLSMKDMICSFAGLRSHFSGGDFHIERALNNERFINLIGIDSPGLASSPAIAEYTAGLALKGLCEPKKKQGFNAGRRKPVVFRDLSDDAKAALIAENPAYAEVVCRCETVTRGEIEDAIRAPAGARDLDGIKRRTRAGMGRCQGSFCGIRTAEILAKELGLPLTEITKRGGGSDIFYERTESYE